MKPTQGMVDAAQQGLDYRREYGRGGTEVGIARARDIVNGRNLSPETVRRMKAFFDRHEQNRNSATKEPDGGPANGWIAWLLWGGDPGRTWAETQVRRMETASAELTDFGPINLAEDDTIERQIFRWGPVEHPAGDFVVNQEFARDMMASFEAMAGQGYFPPVLFEHSSAGTIKGLVRGLRVTGEGVNAILELAAGVKELADRGELHYLSPSFYAEFKSPTDGRLLRFALREVSFVSVPHLKNLRVESLHYALQEAQIMPEEMDMMAVREAVDAALAAMEARVVALETAVAELAKPSEEEVVEEEVVENPEHYGDKEKEMSERVSRLEADNRRLLRQLAEREIMTELGNVDNSTMKNLVELREANQRLYRTVVDTMKSAKSSSTDLSERGVVGQTPVGPVTYDRAVEMGEAKGIKRGTIAMVEYLANKHPHLMA